MGNGFLNITKKRYFSTITTADGISIISQHKLFLKTVLKWSTNNLFVYDHFNRNLAKIS